MRLDCGRLVAFVDNGNIHSINRVVNANLSENCRDSAYHLPSQIDQRLIGSLQASSICAIRARYSSCCTGVSGNMVEKLQYIVDTLMQLC